MENRIFYLLLILILISGFAIRLSYAFKWSLYEPDSFYHESIILQAIQNHGVIPTISKLDNAQISEPSGLYLVTLIPYYLFNGSINVINIMQWLPPLFWILTAISLYFLLCELTKDKRFIIIALLILAFSQANVARSFAGSYRGDDFIILWLVLGMLLLVKSLKQDKLIFKASLIILAGLSLALGFIQWNGGVFLFVVFIVAYAIFFILSYIKLDSKYLRYNFSMAIMLVIYSLFVVLFGKLGLAIGEAIQPIPILIMSIIFLGFSILLSLFTFPSYLPKWQIKRKHLLIFIPLIIIIFGIFLAFFAGNTIYSVIANTNTAQTGAINIAASQTIEELQPSSPSFIFSQYTSQVYMTPMMLAFVIISFFGNKFLDFATLIIIFSIFLWYLNKKNLIDFTNPVIILFISLFIVTAFLASNEIRFLYLFSPAVAIFSAYTIILILDKFQYNKQVLFVILLVLLGLLVFYTVINVPLQVQADGANPAFFSALNWIKSNTPANATFLTEWSDGSAIEAYGRFSFTDSVGAQNIPRNNNFSTLIIGNTTLNSSDFIPLGKPSYILIRQFWGTEFPAILEEDNVSPTSYFDSGKYQESNYVKLLNGCLNCNGLIEVYHNSQNMVYQINYSVVT